MQEALDAYGMTEVHEPTWLPDGYALDSVDVLALDDPFLRSFEVTYSNGDGRVGIDIINYEGEPATQVQKIDGPVKSVERNGTTFYIIKNEVGGTIAWYTDQYECYLTLNREIDILWEMADSMFV